MKPMRSKKPMRSNRVTRLCALCAWVVLSIGSVSAPLALAAKSADVCGMACCINEGHCCCSPRHSRVEGQSVDGKPGIIDSSALSAPCPEGCVTSGCSSNVMLRAQLRAAAHQIVISVPARTCGEQLIGYRATILPAESSPRAPPLS